LNYNSPGATGALPVAIDIVKELVQKNIVNGNVSRKINFPFKDEFE
jgi:(S)-2-hydroxyglutarate dehydrogenase